MIYYISKVKEITMNKIAVSLLIAVAFFMLCSSASFADDNAFKIAGMSGKVLVKISPSTEWTAASVGQTLKQQDYVKTEADGKVVLELSDKSSVSLKRNTEIMIEELAWDSTARKAGINMTSGQLKTIIKKVNTPSDFKVKTPTAICGARGTIFYVIIYENGTGVYVEEGLVDFLNTISGESYSVYKGMTSDSRQDGTTTAPREISKEEVSKIVSEYDVQLVAEPYSEPAGNNTPGDVLADEFNAPDVTPENPASQT